MRRSETAELIRPARLEGEIAHRKRSQHEWRSGGDCRRPASLASTFRYVGPAFAAAPPDSTKNFIVSGDDEERENGRVIREWS
jgi:hypothetical protein